MNLDVNKCVRLLNSVINAGTKEGKRKQVLGLNIKKSPNPYPVKISLVSLLFSVISFHSHLFWFLFSKFLLKRIIHPFIFIPIQQVFGQFLTADIIFCLTCVRVIFILEDFSWAIYSDSEKRTKDSRWKASLFASDGPIWDDGFIISLYLLWL